MTHAKEHRIFAVLALLFGFLMVLLVPPFQSPDEDSHYKKAFVMSEFRFFPKNVNGQRVYSLPINMISYIAQQNGCMGNLYYKFSFKDMYLNERLDNNFLDRQDAPFSTVSSNPVAHVVPAVGMVLGKIIYKVTNQSSCRTILGLLYWGRSFNLLFYVLIFAIAIKLTPLYKKIFCMVGLFPMSVYLASSISYDMTIIAFSALFVAYFLKLYLSDMQINIKDFILVGLILVPLFVIKPNYVLPAVLLLFISKERFKNDKIYNKKWFCILGAVAITVILKLLYDIPLSFISQSTAVNAKEQLSFIFNNPFEYIIILFKNIVGCGYYYLSGMIGIFGLIDTNIPIPFILLFFMSFLFFALLEISSVGDKVKVSVRIASFLIVCIEVVAIITALYVFWTSMAQIGGREISGVQGRYFLPLLPFCFIPFSNSLFLKNTKLRKFSENTLRYYFVPSTIMLSLSCLIILVRFWV